jgi:2-polyprenyl-6-methoxyphenol hydroxylase-like FAD-dependent oxidoreductase
MDAKGQGCLQNIGVWDRVAPHCAEVVGRVDWMPGSDKPQEVDFLEKFGYPIQVIQRDCLTALLREEIEDKYADQIQMLYNTECQSVTWGARPGDPVHLKFQKTERIVPKGELRGARPVVKPVGEPIEVKADFVIGADGVSSRVRDAMESDPAAEEVSFALVSSV